MVWCHSLTTGISLERSKTSKNRYISNQFAKNRRQILTTSPLQTRPTAYVVPRILVSSRNEARFPLQRSRSLPVTSNFFRGTKLFSNKPWILTKCDKNPKKAVQEGQLSVSLLSSSYFDVFWDLFNKLLNFFNCGDNSVNVSSVSVRRSAGMLTLETPALESIYGGQFTIVNSATQHYSFFRNLAP